MAKGATIREWPRGAGWSIATVSRVVSGKGPVSTDSERRVRGAIAELGFRPNTIGRSLQAARSRTVGVLIPSLSNPIFAESVAGVHALAAEHGYSVLIASTDYSPEREALAVESLLSNRVEGLVLTVADGDRSTSLDASGTPYVLAYNQTFVSGRPFVSVDNVAAARAIAERMIRLGHRRIGMVAGRFRQSDRSRLRHEGFCAAIEAAGLHPGPLIEVDFADVRLVERLARHMDQPDPPTALFGSNDLLALATVGALQDLGLRVPGDVSVTGFDGIEVGALVSPRLSTLVQPARLMGRTAVSLLLQRLAGGTPPSSILLPFAIRAGETLGAPPAARRRPAFTLSSHPTLQG